MIFHITCVKKNRRGTITEVGLRVMVGEQPLMKQCETKESVARRIGGGDVVYVRPAGSSARGPLVRVVRGLAGVYLRTDADETMADNLGELPECTDC